jgi:hypothetical protein
VAFEQKMKNKKAKRRFTQRCIVREALPAFWPFSPAE